MHRLQPEIMYASLREYLNELQESGVDGVPYGDLPADFPDNQAETVASPYKSAVIQTLDELAGQIGDCRRCQLAKNRTCLVFGSGNPSARLMFIGDAPDAADDLAGEPFTGEPGNILTRIIDAMGMKRNQVYICNLLKCRIPPNRTAHKDEISSCRPFLRQQIRLVKPEVIVTLGTLSSQVLLGTKEPISRMRGQFHIYDKIAVMPTFHPAFLMRNKDNKQLYWEVWNDMTQVLLKLKLPVPEKKRQAAST